MYLKNDMKNWIEYKLAGSRIFMREDVVPHKFLDFPKQALSATSQLSPLSRKRRSEFLEKFETKSKKVHSHEGETLTFSKNEKEIATINANQIKIEPPSEEFISTIHSETDVGSITPSTSSYYMPECVKTEFKYCCKEIQVDIKPNTKNVAVQSKMTSRRNSNRKPSFRSTGINTEITMANATSLSSSCSLGNSSNSDTSVCQPSSSAGAGGLFYLLPQNVFIYAETLPP